MGQFVFCEGHFLSNDAKGVDVGELACELRGEPGDLVWANVAVDSPGRMQTLQCLQHLKPAKQIVWIERRRLVRGRTLYRIALLSVAKRRPSCRMSERVQSPLSTTMHGGKSLGDRRTSIILGTQMRVNSVQERVRFLSTGIHNGCHWCADACK